MENDALQCSMYISLNSIRIDSRELFEKYRLYLWMKKVHTIYFSLYISITILNHMNWNCKSLFLFREIEIIKKVEVQKIEV